MNYISLENISKSYGVNILFENINFNLNQYDKTALIAKNGSGKTALLKLIAGEDTADSGTLFIQKNIQIQYLAQEPALNPNWCIMDCLFNSNSPIIKAVEAYEKALQTPEETNLLQKCFDQMDQMQAWDVELRYKQVLDKLKIQDTSSKISHLSGGQKKRVALATLLIQKPDVLILDEPTNHLDLEMIEWLEDFLNKEAITLLMVTHDRYFLECVCTKILELDEKKIYAYQGNYSYYLEKRAERITATQAHIEKARNLYSRELEWMRRQPKARTTKAKSRIDQFHTIKETALQKQTNNQLELEIDMPRLGNQIIDFEKVTYAYDPHKIILNQFNYHFQKKERLGIIGKNGTGKTTFLNLLTQKILPQEGKIIAGDTLKIGYYTQQGLIAEPGTRVIEVIKNIAPYIPLTKDKILSAEQLLERFLFNSAKQYDFVEKLSGGEKKRLLLCTILIQNPNFLILDEPTNDLDIITLNILESFLLDFQGCLLVVSHDRYFMDKIVSKLLIFKGNALIETFTGNYSDYCKTLDITTTNAPENISKKIIEKTKKVRTQLSYQEKRTLEQLDQELPQLEEKKRMIEQLFNDANLPIEEMQEKSIELGKILIEIDQKTALWFELQMKLEA